MQHGVYQGIKRTLDRFKKCKHAAYAIKEKRKALKAKASDSFSTMSNECKSLDTCDKLIFAEMIGEVACCAFSSFS